MALRNGPLVGLPFSKSGKLFFLSFVRVAVAKRRFSADLSTLQIKFYHNTCLRFFSSINQLNHQTISRSSLIMEKNPKIQTLPTKSSCTQPFIFQSAWLHSNEFYWQLGRNKAFTVGDEHIHAVFCVIPIFPLNSAHNKCLLEVYIQRQSPYLQLHPAVE